MKRIIDISEEVYCMVKHYNWYSSRESLNDIEEAISNSTPLNEVEAEDCIKRDDALDIVSGTYEKDGYGESNFYKEISELPSVYPKSDKPNTVSEETYTQEYIARKEADMEVYKLKKQIERLENDKPSGEWISISKRLPDIGTEVLLCDRGKCYVVSLEFEEYSEDGGGYYWEDSHGDFFECEDDQAWQPLPSPYTVEEQGENK